MITKLTAEQEKLLNEYIKKGVEFGLSTTDFTDEEAKDICDNFNRVIMNREPNKVIVVDNPFVAWKTISAIEGKDAVDTKNEMLPNYISSYTQGSFDCDIFFYYDYYINVLGVKLDAESQKLYEVWKSTLKLGQIWFLDNVTVVSRKPIKIKTNENGLHADGEAALEYRGGFKIYALNGITVPEYLAMTPSGKLTLDFYTNESRADIRTEFVKKFGVDRMLELGKKIDSFDNPKYKGEWYSDPKFGYEVWDMSCLFQGVQYAPHLRMVNQTTQVFHVEPLSPSVRNLKDAINERLGGRDLDITDVR